LQLNKTLNPKNQFDASSKRNPGSSLLRNKNNPQLPISLCFKPGSSSAIEGFVLLNYIQVYVCINAGKIQAWSREGSLASRAWKDKRTQEWALRLAQCFAFIMLNAQYENPS